MKRFFKTLIKFSVLILILITIHSSLIYFINLKINKNYNLYIPSQPKYAVFGHSHPLCAFDEAFIDDFYNLSSSGERFFYTYLKIKKIVVDNPSLKTVFFELGDVQITASSDTNTWNDANIDNRLPRYSPLMKSEDYFLLFRKNPIRFARDFISLPKKQLKRIIAKNYSIIEFKETVNKSKITQLEQQDDFSWLSDKKNINESFYNLYYLDKIIAFCETKKLEVILVRSPVHKKWIRQNIENKLKSIIKRKYNKFKYLDFRDLPLSNEEYKDYSHLNTKGAKKFSILFNKLLKQGILDSRSPQDIINKNMKYSER